MSERFTQLGTNSSNEIWHESIATVLLMHIRCIFRAILGWRRNATVLAGALLVVGAPAAAADVYLKPHFYYTPNTVDGAFPSADAAFAAYKAWELQLNVTRGPDDRYWIIPLSYDPIESDGKTNGQWNAYKFLLHHPQACGQTPCYGNLMVQAWECGDGTFPDPTYIGIDTIARCIYREPTPDCECKPNALPPSVGNPIFPGTGLKQQVENDYHGTGANTLSFVRTYRSDRHGWQHNFQAFGLSFSAASANLATGLPPDETLRPGCYPFVGSTTKQLHCFEVTGDGVSNQFVSQRANGRLTYFGNTSGLNPAADVNDRAIPGGSNWTVTRANDEVERYDALGHLQMIADRKSNNTRLTYSDAATPKQIAPKAGMLIGVVSQSGAKISLVYDAVGRLATMIDPAGGQYHYAYDESSSVVPSGANPVGNLTSVTFPDGGKRVYWYNEPVMVDGPALPFALTGITDENGARFASFHYAYGKAVSTEHAGGVEKYVVDYSYSNVTNPLGMVQRYDYQTILDVVRQTGTYRPANGTTSDATEKYTYDGNGNVATSVDFNGVTTTYSYDLSRNLETSHTEASGTAQARTTTTEWHPSYRIAKRIAEPKLLTTMTHDAQGNVLTRTLQATTDENGSLGFGAALSGVARTWTYTYNTVGQVLTVSGPRTDVADKTTYTYDSSGNMKTLMNAVGQVTTFNNYDLNGRLTSMTDPNGVVTTMTYTPRGWLSTVTVQGAGSGATQTTKYTYDGVGQMKTATAPDGSVVSYSYDDAHRLYLIADSAGDSITYTLDNMGNRTGEAVKDPSGALARAVTRTYDALNNLKNITGAVQ